MALIGTIQHYSFVYYVKHFSFFISVYFVQRDFIVIFPYVHTMYSDQIQLLYYSFLASLPL
jgi:hypothetical protein